MSVLIKDMEMPETCEDCPFNYDEMSCTITGTRWWVLLEDFDYTKERLYDCPLSEAPSAQPDPLTDKEQRIFLVAMEKEKNLCKQVDYECRKPYEDSLVRSCYEIIRKVKGALWT